MRQDRIARVCALLALLAVVAVAPAGAGATASKSGAAYRNAVAAQPMAAKKKSASKARKSASKSLRQFTGTVTDLDKGGFTVEKGGKKARSMVFVRHEKMRTTGDLEKGAHVTVYYREEGEKAVAHRVVVKDETAGRESGE